MLLHVRNPIDAIEEITALSQVLTAGNTNLIVLNTQGIVTDDYILIGNLGEEQTELQKVSSISGNGTINLTSSASFIHSPGITVSKILYNQVELSYKTTSNGSWSVITTTDLEPDDIFTTYNHTTGVDSYFYRIRFFNSTSGQYTDYSEVLAGTGETSDQIGPMIDFVLEQTNGVEGKFTSRGQVLKYLEYARQDVINTIFQASSEYFIRYIDIPTENYKHTYTLPSDFREISEIRDGDGQIVKSTPRSVINEDAQGYEIIDGKLYLNDVPEPASDATTPITVLSNNAYSEEGTWVASGDATNVTTDLDEFKTGNGSVNFDVDVSADAGNVAIMTNSTFTAEDLSDYEDSGKWRIWVYLPDVTYMTSVTLRWGSDSTNYWSLAVTKDYKDEALVDGWNLLEFDWSDASVVETLTPDSSAIDYLQLRFTYGTNQPDATDFRIDAVLFSDAFSRNNIYTVKYLYQPTPLRGEMDVTGLPVGNTALLCDYAIARIEYRKDGRETVARRFENSYQEQKNRFITQSAKRTRRMRGFRPLGRERNYANS
jgi:hypothetical protein